MAPLELAPAVFDRGLIRGGVPASTFLAMATVVFLASGEDLGASARDVGDAGVSFPFLEGAVEGRRGGDAVPETPMTPSPPLPFFIPALIPRRADHSANETDASAAAGWAVEAVEVVAEAGLACNLARVGVMDVTRAGIATVFTGGEFAVPPLAPKLVDPPPPTFSGIGTIFRAIATSSNGNPMCVATNPMLARKVRKSSRRSFLEPKV